MRAVLIVCILCAAEGFYLGLRDRFGPNVCAGILEYIRERRADREERHWRRVRAKYWGRTCSIASANNDGGPSKFPEQLPAPTAGSPPLLPPPPSRTASRFPDE